MTVIAKPLVTAAYAADSQTTIYTAPAGTRTIIDKLTGYSPAGGTLTVNIVPSGGAAGAGNIVAAKTLSAGETYTFPEVVGHVLETGGFVSVIAVLASTVVRRMSGREVS